MQESLDEHIRHPHEEFCDGLTDEIEMHHNSFLASQGDQVVMGDSAPAPKADKALKHLTHVHHSNCRFQQLPTKMAAENARGDIDLRAALLQFMVAATPSDHVVNEILGNFEHYLSKMVEYMQGGSHFAPSEEPTYFMVDNVPDAVGPVKATLAYHQVPGKDDSVHLSLVWKVRNYLRFVNLHSSRYAVRS
jgi:extracellular elastinolytic metalloproteinase